MTTVRSIVFWCHLLAGVSAGLVILDMSASGAILALKPQILNRLERDVRFVPPSDGPRVDASRILAAARGARPDAQPATLTIERDPAAAVAVGFGRDATVFVNPYTGAVLGEGSKTAQTFFRAAEDWHRWLAADAENRAGARAVTDAANLTFLVLAISGVYIWWPRKWTPQHVKPILAFKRTTSSRARDFNWHNVVGFWCAPVIIIMTATAVVMSYSWANDLLYRATGTPPPPRVERAGGPGQRGGPQPRAEGRPSEQIDIDALWARAAAQLPTWSAIVMRLPDRPDAPVAFTMSDGAHWNRFARSQLTLNGSNGAVVRWQPYAETPLGQKARGWVRFAHTGELGGVAAQLLAGLACIGGVVLVWTGLSLAVRRLVRWRIWRLLARPPVVVASE